MASVDRINGLTGNLGIKAPVRCATTANITLSGLQTIDGITVVAGDRVLVKDQTDATENGIYAASSTAWTREPDFDGNRDIVKGTLVRVNEGTASANLFYGVTSSDPITIGSSNIAFASAGITASTYMQTLLDDASAAAARATLGSTTVGDAIFIAASAAAARAALALGTSAIYDVNSTGSSSIPQLGVDTTWSGVQTFTNGIKLGTTALTNTVCNRAIATYASYANLATVIPADDTIPQSTEGTQIASTSLTPQTTSSRIRVRFRGFVSANTANDIVTAALFINSATDAAAATAAFVTSTSGVATFTLEYEYVPASTSAQTLSIRVGAKTDRAYMNGTAAGTRLYGGVAQATLIVEEFLS